MMSALLLSFSEFGAQYLCTAALILICTLSGAHLFLTRMRKTDMPHEISEAEPNEEPAEPPCEMKEADRSDLAEFETREQVSAAEVQSLISDEVAVALIEEVKEAEEAVLSKPKGIVNIDTLSENYEANETVTLESLKEKKLIGNSVNHVKVLARGILNKPLTVKLPEFSVDAVKMILLTGGKAIKLQTKK